MARYGDIVEINGQLVEFTPVGYVPIAGREGMLTKPAPTTKQTGPIGTPSTPPKQMPGESGPFDPNAPVPTPAPAPAPAPQQTGPVGTPSSDPTKTQPGETGPFDPNAEPPAPAPAPEPEAELAPPKPLQDTKEPAPEPEGITTFTFFEGVERGDANPNALYARGNATQVTEAELREYFNAQGSQMLKRSFGDFDNYLAYMTEREQLIQSGNYDVGNWDEATGGLTEDELMILEGEDLTQYSDSDQDVYTEAYGERMQEQSAAYDNWINSEANQELLAKYGVGSTIYNNDGDKYEWNGSAYVKTVKQDQAGLVDYVKMGIVTAMGIMTGGAVSAVAPSLGTIGSSVVSNAITQAITTGSIDPDELLQTAATAGFSQALNQVIGPALSEAMGGLDISEITGIEELDNVLNAMGQTAIRQAVFDGDLDMEGIVASGLLTGAQEVVEFLFGDLAGQQAISEEQQQELEKRFAEYAAVVDEDTMAEVNRVMGNTVNEAIATQQNEAMRNQLQALAGNLQSVYEQAYAPTTPPVDITASTVDEADSELADTTADLTADITVDDGPMESIMYVDDQAVPADRVAEILEGSTVVTTLDGSGDYEYGPMEVGDTYLAYHTQHVDESGIEYTLIRGSDGRLYVSDGTNLVEYQGASDLTHNNAQISWLDSHLVSGGGLPTDTNNARWLDVTIDGAGTPEDSMTNRILENMEAGWQDVNNPTLESSMAAPTPDTPLETEVEVDPFEYEIEPELTPEPPPESDTPITETIFPEYFPEPPPEQPPIDPSQTPDFPGGPPPVPVEGPRGEPGQPGRDGTDGAPGRDGTDGAPGRDGTDGTDGRDGVDGAPGRDGTDGRDGIDGAPGRDGTDGRDGRDGVDGQRGEQGEQGEQGPRGEQGEPGRDADPEEIRRIINGAIEGIKFPEGITTKQIEDIVKGQIDRIPGGVTSDQVASIVGEAIKGIKFPEGVTTKQIKELFENAIGEIAIASPGDVKDALAGFAFTESQINQIVGALPENINKLDLANALEGVVVGEDLDSAVGNITKAISGLDVASPNDVKQILSEYGFTEEQLDQISGAITIPASATVEDVKNIVAGIPKGLTAQEVATQLSGDFEDLTKDIAGVKGGIDDLAESLGLSTDGLIRAISDLGDTTGEDLTNLQTGILKGLGDLSEDFGTDIGEVVKSVTGLSGDVADGIEDLGEQLTGIGTGIGDVNKGIDDLAESLGLSTDALVKAISGLGESTGESLTNLQTDILKGLGDISKDLGVDIGDVVKSVTGLGEGISKDIEGLEEQLTGIGTGVSGVETGIKSLAESLGLSTEALVKAVSDLGTSTGEDLTDLEKNILQGIGDLSTDLGLDIGEVVTSIGGLKTDVSEGIAGLGEDVEAVGEAVGGVKTSVDEGIKNLAESLGIQTEDITKSIVKLGTGVSQDITELDASVLKGLDGLASNLGTDIGEVVTSITGLGTDLGESIKNLSEGITGQLTTEFGGLSDALGEGFGGLGEAIGTGLGGLGEGIAGLGEGLGAGLMGLAAQQSMLPGQIAAATPIQPQDFKEFRQGLTRRKLATPLQIGMFTGGARNV